MSEDLVLTAEPRRRLREGLQDRGIAACPKHYIANDFETERFTADVIVDERTLRMSSYLRPFEDAVIDGGTWTIMSSYNLDQRPHRHRERPARHRCARNGTSTAW